MLQVSAVDQGHGKTNGDDRILCVNADLLKALAGFGFLSQVGKHWTCKCQPVTSHGGQCKTPELCLLGLVRMCDQSAAVQAVFRDASSKLV